MNKPKLRIIELCAGCGMQRRGVENTGLFDVEVVATSEIDRHAIISYAAIHEGLTNEKVISSDLPTLDEMRQYLTRLNIGYVPEKNQMYDWYRNGKKFEDQIRKTYLACQLNHNLGDMSKINVLPEADVWFTSTPCQSISVAGRLDGLNPDDNTRSSLIWHNIRLLKAAQDSNTLPKYIMLENVKNLVGNKFIKDFEKFNELIESFGYNTYWEVINGKDCGVPQNRERVFAIYIRKDIDNGRFTFPKPFDNGLRLKDVLEDEVDEKYYIDTPKARQLIQDLLDRGVIGNNKSSVEGIDLSISKPKEIEVANCVSARTDRGISNRTAEGSGICELHQN